MPNEQLPNDPYRPGLSDDDYSRRSSFNDQMRFDPELAGPPAGGVKIAVVAIALALFLGVVFYGLSNSNKNEAGITPPTQTAQEQPGGLSKAPPGMRDVTPRRSNTDPGMTTGAAPIRPATPAAPTTPPDASQPANPAQQGQNSAPH